MTDRTELIDLNVHDNKRCDDVVHINQGYHHSLLNTVLRQVHGLSTAYTLWHTIIGCHKKLRSDFVAAGVVGYYCMSGPYFTTMHLTALTNPPRGGHAHSQSYVHDPKFLINYLKTIIHSSNDLQSRRQRDACYCSIHEVLYAGSLRPRGSLCSYRSPTCSALHQGTTEN